MFYGAARDEGFCYGQTVLIIASEKGCGKIVAELLLPGADATIEDGFGWTAKMYAVFYCHKSVGQVLNGVQPRQI